MGKKYTVGEAAKALRVILRYSSDHRKGRLKFLSVQGE